MPNELYLESNGLLQGRNSKLDKILDKLYINTSIDFINMPVITTNIDYFVGRNEKLTELGNSLEKGNPLLLLNGLGAIGKTTLALEFVNLHKSNFKYCVWVAVQEDIQNAIANQFAKAWNMVFDDKATEKQQ